MIELPALLPDPARATRTRARCHKKLMRAPRPRERHVAVERRLFLCFGALYIASVVFDVMRVLIP